MNLLSQYWQVECLKTCCFIYRNHLWPCVKHQLNLRRCTHLWLNQPDCLSFIKDIVLIHSGSKTRNENIIFVNLNSSRDLHHGSMVSGQNLLASITSAITQVNNKQCYISKALRWAISLFWEIVEIYKKRKYHHFDCKNSGKYSFEIWIQLLSLLYTSRHDPYCKNHYIVYILVYHPNSYCLCEPLYIQSMISI